MHLSDFNINICIVYRHSLLSYQDNLALMEFLELMCENKEIFVLDDLNLPTLTWQINNVSQSAVHLESMF